MGEYFTSKDMDTLIYYQVPKVLLLGESYKHMNLNALKIYIILIDRVKLSMMNGWKDEKGRYYVRLGIDKGADLLGMAPSTFKRAKKELADMGLLEEVREGLNKPNRLYPKQLDYTEADIYKLNNELDDVLKEEEENAKKSDEKRKGQNEPTKAPQRKGQNELSGKGQNEPSEENQRMGQNEPTREVKMSQQDGSKSATNKNESSKSDNSENENAVNIDNNVGISDKLNELEILSREQIAFELIKDYMLNRGLPKDIGLAAYEECKDKDNITNFERYFKSTLENIMLNININYNLRKRGNIYNWLEEDGEVEVTDDDLPFGFRNN